MSDIINRDTLPQLKNSLGFSTAELATYLQIDIPTLQACEQGTATLSVAHCKKLLEAQHLVEYIIGATKKRCTRESQHYTQRHMGVCLLTYPDSCYAKYVTDFHNLPNSVYRQMLHRVVAELHNTKIRAYIITFNEESYLQFLQDNQQLDTQETRAQWAVWQHQQLQFYRAVSLE